MKRWLVPSFLLSALAACATASATQASPTVRLHGHTFSIELATDDASRAQGLMFRTELAADRGMLFVFPYTDQQAFWMKNTLIPLDMLYFDDRRALVSMQLDVPPCKADPCATYPSNAPARYVLELPAGTVARIGAQPGDVLEVKGEIGPVR
ncbi:hypothetical protein ASG87_16035 [Frateuria sp. Soil773]|uniref:DUF192 domain-containing protein n=1 Tax=Frateuria sp. Soil773 TaxID=1736407 RepID=UPI00070045A0|nr:DUF192 domain-containing protein [Frateuria sp. Soil773]KRE96504.1 hypothetical protein ASG87_16035 [Frateuria sp. Soil773]